MYDSRRYPPQRYESKGVCVWFFFRLWKKTKATGGEKLRPIFLDQTGGTCLCLDFLPPRVRTCLHMEEQTPKNLLVTDQRLRISKVTYRHSWGASLDCRIWLVATQSFLDVCTPTWGRWTHFDEQLGILSFQDLPRISTLSLAMLKVIWSEGRILSGTSCFRSLLAWKKSFLLVVVVYGDNGDTWFTIQIISHPVFFFGAWIFSEPAQAGFPRCQLFWIFKWCYICIYHCVCAG